MKRILSFVLSFLCIVTYGVEEYTQTIIDFEVSNTTFWGTNPFIATDDWCGGNSSASWNPLGSNYLLPQADGGAKGTKHYLKVDYSLIKNNCDGDPQITFNIRPSTENDSTDLGQWEGVRYWFKGDAHEFQINLSSIKDYNRFFVSIPQSDEWTEVVIPWFRLKQHDWEPTTFVEWDSTIINNFVFEFKSATDTDGSFSIDEFELFSNSEPFLPWETNFVGENVTGLENITGATYQNRWSIDENRVINSLNFTDDIMNIVYKREIKDVWSGLYLSFIERGASFDPFKSSPSDTQSEINGTTVNIIDRPLISFKVKVDKPLTLRIDLADKNGRTANSESQSLLIEPQDDWQDISLAWNPFLSATTFISQTIDKYQPSRYGVTYDGEPQTLDVSNIGGLVMIIDAGQDGTVGIEKNIQIKNFHIGSYAIEKSWDENITVSDILPVPIEMGHQVEFTEYSTSFTLQQTQADSAFVNLFYYGSNGPNYENAPILTINGNEYETQSSMPVPDETELWWQNNLDDTWDLRIPCNIKVPISTSDLVLGGENTITFKPGRVDEYLILGNIEVVTSVFEDLTGLSISESESIRVKENKKLSVTPLPSLSKLPSLTWTSSDKNVCTVSQNGEITGVSEGDAVITVSSANDATIFAVCSVQVNPPKTYESFTLLDFENGLVSGWGSSLYAYTNDSTTGGSTIFPDPRNMTPEEDLLYNTERESTYGKFNIDLDPAEMQWGANAELHISTPTYGVPEDLSQWDGIYFWHKGDATMFYIKLEDMLTWEGFNPYHVLVPASTDWTLHVFKWEDFKQWDDGEQFVWDASKIYQFAFRNDSQIESTVIYSIDDITLFSTNENFAERIEVPQIEKLSPNESVTITPIVYPSSAQTPSYSWKSSNDAIAIVDESGTVTGVNSGIATITCTNNLFPFQAVETNVMVYSTGDVVSLNKLIHDFESSTISNWGIPLYTASDIETNEGGQSTVYPTTQDYVDINEMPRFTGGANNSDACIKVEYNLQKADYLYEPWAHMGIPTGENQRARDLSGFHGIEFWHKGDEINLQVAISNVTDYADYFTTIPASEEWIKHRIYWNDLVQPHWGRTAEWDASAVLGFKFGVFGTNDKSGEFYIDEISLFVSSYVPLTGIELPAKKSIAESESLQLQPTLYPIDASTPLLKWVSSNPTIASVSSDGVVSAHTSGICTITTITPEGYSSSTTITVTESVTEPTSINLMPVTIKEGSSILIEPLIMPSDAIYSGITWTCSDETVATITQNGVAHGLKAGTATLTAKIDGTNLASTVGITVQAISQLTLESIPAYHLTDDTPSTDVNLNEYISSSNGTVSWEILYYNFAKVTLFQNVVTIDYSQVTNTENGYCIIKGTDEAGSSSITQIDFTYEEDVIAKTDTISLLLNERSQSIAISLDDLFSTFEAGSDNNVTLETSSDKISVNIVDGVVIVSDNEMAQGGETITLRYNESDIILAVTPSTAQNTAPKIKSIPEQHDVEGYFVDIDLNNYVEDDYTIPAKIKWTYKPTKKFSIDIFNNRVSTQAMSQTWMGTETIWLYATDASGLKDSVAVSYTKETVSEIVDGTPVYVDFTANKLMVTPGTPILFQPDFMNVSFWIWEFPGVELENEEAFNQTISYSELGKQSVMLSGQSPKGVIEKTIKHNYIEVVGITTLDTTIIRGSELTLSVSNSITNYTWDNGVVNESITVSPTETTDYIVRIQNGLIKLYDTVRVNVVSPANLGEDRSICSEDVLYPGKYESYLWSDNSSDSVLTVTEPGEYTVTVQTGTYTQIETVTISMFEKTLFDAGDDIAICPSDNGSVTLPDGFSYVWDNGITTQVNDQLTEGDYSITATDVNGCTYVDSLSVTLKEPFVEPLGVVTVNEASNNMIVAWERTQDKETESYNVYKSTLYGFEKIGSVPFSSPGLFFDLDSDVRQTQFTYAITTVNACGDESEKSTPHMSTHVVRGIDPDGNYTLTWNKYDGKEVQGYKIYGGTSAETFTVKKELPNSNTSYIMLDTEKNFTYRVGVVFADEVDPTRLKTDSGPFSQSLSNLSEAIIESGINSGNAKIDIYPNPVQAELTISCSEEFTYSIISAQGTVIKTGKCNNSIKVDMEDIPVGIYSIQIETFSGTYSKRVLKQ